MALLISPLGDERLDEVARLVNSAYRGESSRKGWTTEADLLVGVRTTSEALAAIIGKPRKIILGLRQQEGAPLVGCVLLEGFTDAKGTGCYLGMLTVSPELQNAGLGKALLAASEQFAAREWGATRMTLGVIPLRETLMAWYQRHGYRRTGEIKAFPYEDPLVEALRDDLELWMFEKTI